jgi:NAD(P)-dependent dehydrogenase (short-subunit alcohol dehydrogenase family)
VVGFSQAMQKELGQEGIQVTALCPGFVDTPMTEWARGQVKQEEMIQPEDIAEGVRLLLRTSPHCVIPEIVFARPSEQLEGVP